MFLLIPRVPLHYEEAGMKELKCFKEKMKGTEDHIVVSNYLKEYRMLLSKKII